LRRPSGCSSAMITTFCPRCGSENPFDNQFCGKCGIPLLQPKPAEPVAAARANGSQRTLSASEPYAEPEQTISGPSFLGLSDEPELSSYLLDDEVSHSHWGLYLFLVVLAGAGVLVWWQARHGGLNRTHLAELVQQARSRITQQKQEAAAVAPNSNPGAAENATAAESVPTPAPAADKTAAAGQPPNGNSAVAPAPSPAQIQNAAEKQNGSTAPAALSETAAVAKPPGVTPKSRARRQPIEPSDTTPAADAQNAALLANAQKYLYGTGVPKSCDRALSYLRQASDNNSAKAKSTLGGLYATGHCVPLDRAVAYRWFAMALRQEPNNSYVSHDLEMLWNQMTAQEKQLAVRMMR
jgi:ribosomal protein L40E